MYILPARIAEIKSGRITRHILSPNRIDFDNCCKFGFHNTQRAVRILECLVFGELLVDFDEGNSQSVVDAQLVQFQAYGFPGIDRCLPVGMQPENRAAADIAHWFAYP